MAMRIVFMGTPEFALTSLDVLLKNGYEIPLVVTVPDRPRGRGQQPAPSPIKHYALAHRIPILQPEKLTEPVLLQTLQTLQPDLIVVVAFRILPREVYSIPKYGSINLHASLLPKYRGAAPIQWAIINGESETGVTSFFLREVVDTGSIILQQRIPIGENETAGEVHDKLSNLGGSVVLETVQRIEAGTVRPQVQEESAVSYAPKIFTRDCKIHWDASSQDIHNFIRGLSPQPCAWTRHKGKLLKLYRSLPLDSKSAEPGLVHTKSADQLLIGTKNGSISILEIQQEGRSRLPIREFLRGYTMAVGDRLE